jgi:hypothetical protein
VYKERNERHLERLWSTTESRQLPALFSTAFVLRSPFHLDSTELGLSAVHFHFCALPERSPGVTSQSSGKNLSFLVRLAGHIQ